MRGEIFAASSSGTLITWTQSGGGYDEDYKDNEAEDDEDVVVNDLMMM